MIAGAAPGPAVSDPARTVRGMIIDCGSCTVRGQACADCVVTFLTIPMRPGAAVGQGRPGADGADGAADAADAADAVELDAAERGAITVLARSGLVPPLRLKRVV